jgi:hypothetical protein
MMTGVASGYYIFEPFIRNAAIRARAQEQELEIIADVVREPVDNVREELGISLKQRAPITNWLFYRQGS